MFKFGKLKRILFIAAVIAIIAIAIDSLRSNSAMSYAGGITALAKGESEYSDNCRCKAFGCRPGNAISFRKYCLGTEGRYVPCADYDAGCEN